VAIDVAIDVAINVAINVEQRLLWTTVRVSFIFDAPREQSCSGVH